MTDLDVEITTNASEFSERATSLLQCEPISSSVLAVVLDAILTEGKEHASTGTAADQNADTLWITVVDAGRVVGVAMVNRPYNVFLVRQPAGAPEAIAHALHNAGVALPGVTGEHAGAREFADAWLHLTGQTSVVQISHCAYVLTDLVEPDVVEGAPRCANDGDSPVVAAWLSEFHDEALSHDPVPDFRAEATSRIEKGLTWLWETPSGPVAMACCQMSGDNIARIGPVFTPPPMRKHGFGAAVTAAAVRSALDHGARHVMLYADRSNATSNAIYQRLGFRADHEATDLGFRNQR